MYFSYKTYDIRQIHFIMLAVNIEISLNLSLRYSFFLKLLCIYNNDNNKKRRPRFQAVS